MQWLALDLADIGFTRPHHVRALIAQLDGDEGRRLPPEIFNYDAQRCPLETLPAVRFLPGPEGALQILGVGAQGVSLMTRHARDLARLLLRVEKSLTWRIADGEFAAAPAEAAQHYRVEDFVTRLTNDGQRHARDGNFAALAPELSIRLETALQRQMTFVGISSDRAKITDLVIERSRPVCLGRATSRAFNASVTARFSTNMMLSGPWQLGRLQSKGYGRVVSQ